MIDIIIQIVLYMLIMMCIVAFLVQLIIQYRDNKEKNKYITNTNSKEFILDIDTIVEKAINNAVIDYYNRADSPHLKYVSLMWCVNYKELSANIKLVIDKYTNNVIEYKETVDPELEALYKEQKDREAFMQDKEKVEAYKSTFEPTLDPMLEVKTENDSNTNCESEASIELLDQNTEIETELDVEVDSENDSESEVESTSTSVLDTSVETQKVNPTIEFIKSLELDNATYTIIDDFVKSTNFDVKNFIEYLVNKAESGDHRIIRAYNLCFINENSANSLFRDYLTVIEVEATLTSKHYKSIALHNLASYVFEPFMTELKIITSQDKELVKEYIVFDFGDYIDLENVEPFAYSKDKTKSIEILEPLSQNFIDNDLEVYNEVNIE